MKRLNDLRFMYLDILKFTCIDISKNSKDLRVYLDYNPALNYSKFFIYRYFYENDRPISCTYIIIPLDIVVIKGARGCAALYSYIKDKVSLLEKSI